MELITQKICMTMDIGVCNNLFGGNMLALLDQSAAIFCQKICQTQNLVTLKISEVIFKRPVRVNQIMSVYGEVRAMGTTSVTVDLEVRKFNVHTASEEIVATTTMVFVRVDDEGSPIPISETVRLKFKK